MALMGFFTGKIYDDTVALDSIDECTQILNFKEPISEDEELVVLKRKELRNRCESCYGCPVARNYERNW